MDKKPNAIHENLIPTKYSSYVYSVNSYTTINTPYNWPALLAASCLNIGYMSAYEYVTKGHIATHTILF